MDTKFNLPNGKYKSTGGVEPNYNTAIEDESLLRQPIKTSCTGFWEAKKAYENGTDEVRRLLIQECSIIYECNACRNMFRSLANFISHKLNYCKISAEYNFHSFSDNNTSVLIRTIERPEVWRNKSRSTGSSPIPNVKSSTRDLSKVIERLKRVEVSSKCVDKKDQIMHYKIRPSSPEPKAPDPVIELERVPTTKHAVYQTFKTQSNSESIKTELDEVNNMLMNQTTLLGPDGEEITDGLLVPSVEFSSNKDSGINGSSCESSKNFSSTTCKVCNIHFQTEKTLKMHEQKKHNSSTYVFQCPTCPLTFLQPAAVIRHLANEHKKPLRRIRKMRDTILKRRIQIGNVHIKGSNREVKSLNLNNTNKNCHGSTSLNQENEKTILSCIYCMKNFERRAALATHLSSCIMRKEVSNKFRASKNQMKQTKKYNQNLNQDLEIDGQKDKIQNEKKIEMKVNVMEEPQEDLNSATESPSINQMFENLETQTFGSGLKTVSLEKLEIMIKTNNVVEKQEENNPKTVKLNENNPKTVELNENNAENVQKKLKSKRFRMVSPSKPLTCRCKICNKQFNALSNLRRHISMFHYRSRRFGCNLCDYRAFRRYDIVNHLTFVHKMTGERESMSVEYVTVHEIKYSKDDVEGDIVVVNEEVSVGEHNKVQSKSEQNMGIKPMLAHESVLKTYEKRDKRKNILSQTNQAQDQIFEKDEATNATKDISHVKVVRKKLKKTFVQQVDGQKRPIRNRIKTVNEDFVYDLLTPKEDPKDISRPALKRRNTMLVDQNTITCIQLSTPPIKMTPYKLRTEPLIPTIKSGIKGFATSVYRNVVHEALAAPSTLPELPAERPQMRTRLVSSSRSDSSTVPIIETSELEAARLKSTFLDDSFLEKFAKKSNPSFKMKPLLALQHSPLNSILQKFDATLQNKNYSSENNCFLKPPENTNNSALSYALCSLESLNNMDVTPNGKRIIKLPSPPSTPKKRITLMQRLAENRAKRKDSLLRTALEN